MLKNTLLICVVVALTLSLAACGGSPTRPLVITPNQVDLWNSSTVVNAATLSVSYSDGLAPKQPTSVQWSSSDSKCIGFYSGSAPNTQPTTTVLCGEASECNKTGRVTATIPGGRSVSATVSCAWLP